MEESWENIYSLMLVELNQCKTIDTCEIKLSECSYQVVSAYWERVKNTWKELIYSDTEEIDFFRVVKPLFTCHIEYHLILTQGLLFIPEHPTDAIAYWMEEANRYKRFCDKHETFIRYLTSKYHYRDRDYFLQRNNHHALLPQERVYSDENCRTSHDWLVRSYKANGMYYEYVNKRLEVLQHG